MVNCEEGYAKIRGMHILADGSPDQLCRDSLVRLHGPDSMGQTPWLNSQQEPLNN